MSYKPKNHRSKRSAAKKVATKRLSPSLSSLGLTPQQPPQSLYPRQESAFSVITRVAQKLKSFGQLDPVHLLERHSAGRDLDFTPSRRIAEDDLELWDDVHVVGTSPGAARLSADISALKRTRVVRKPSRQTVAKTPSRNMRARKKLVTDSD